MPGPIKIEVDHLSVSYKGHVAIHDLSLQIPTGGIFALIGPARGGKSTLLKSINRTLELTPGVKVGGTIRIDGEDVMAMRNVYDLRRRIGMVLPLPVGLPISIYDNVAYAPRLAGMRNKAKLDDLVERCLRQAALWDEVKERLTMLGSLLSGGQQQRLTIARALSHEPEILCLDEFSIAIDPVTTMKIEDVLSQLKQTMTILLVTNLVQQARRLGDMTCFINEGRLVQVADTNTMFSDDPGNQLTYDYVHGIFG
jgi:phosphate transport system ATP-binding protein